MKKKIRLILLIIFGLMMFLSLIMFISWLKENKKVAQIVEEEKNNLVIDKNEHLKKEIFTDNPDTIGWLIVKGTNIDYPVVQYSDNEYYLGHDFKKNKNSAGWIFLDYKNSLNDENIVIYGHHRQDGSMFGSIDNLFNKKNNENIEILLITKNKMFTYKVFSVYKTLENSDYIKRNFDDFNKKIKELQNKSEIRFSQDIDTTQIITLSTCHYDDNYRMVVHGYKKRN